MQEYYIIESLESEYNIESLDFHYILAVVISLPEVAKQPATLAFELLSPQSVRAHEDIFIVSVATGIAATADSALPLIREAASTHTAGLRGFIAGLRVVSLRFCVALTRHETQRRRRTFAARGFSTSGCRLTPTLSATAGLTADLR